MEDIKIRQICFKKLIVLFSVLFFILAAINSISQGFYGSLTKDGLERVEINVINRNAEGTGLIKKDRIEDLKKVPLETVSFMNEAEGFVEANNWGYAVKTVLSGENLDRFYGIRMYRGTFFSSEQHAYGSKVAIISDTLAQKLFSTYGVLGNRINISGKEYKIVGVYINDTSLHSLFYSDGAERVFIPFESVSGSKNKPISTVFIQDGKLQEKSFRTHEVENILRKQKIDVDNYKINDFYDSRLFMAQPLKSFIFIIGIAVIFLLLKYLWRFIKFSFNRFRIKLEEGYFFETISRSKLKILLDLMVVVLFMGAMYGTFLLISFKCIIPYQYIPKNNIFDIGFYTSIIRNAIYRANGYAGYIPAKLEILYHNSMTVSLFLMVCLIVTFVLILQTVKMYSLVSRTTYQRFILLPVSLLAGTTAALIACAVLGLAFALPVKGILILSVFFIFKLFRFDLSKQYKTFHHQKIFHTSLMDYIR